jgi:hypothetical protein
MGGWDALVPTIATVATGAFFGVIIYLDLPERKKVNGSSRSVQFQCHTAFSIRHMQYSQQSENVWSWRKNKERSRPQSFLVAEATQPSQLTSANKQITINNSNSRPPN